MSFRIGFVAAIVVVSATLPAPSAAQAIAPSAALAEGTRVRISAMARRDAITGVVVAHSADTLVVKADGDSNTIALPTAQMRKLEISRGKHTQKLRGAAIGFLGGAALGALAGYAAYEEPDCGAEGWFCLDFGPGFDAAVGAALVGAAGALVGALVGNEAREQWRPVGNALLRAARLGVVPARGGVALTTSLPF